MSEYESRKDRELDRLDRGVLSNEKNIGEIRVTLQSIKDAITGLTTKVQETLNTLNNHEDRIDKLEDRLRSVWWLIIGMGTMLVINNVGLIPFIESLFK